MATISSSIATPEKEESELADFQRSQCPICNKVLYSLNGYVKHIKKHEPPGGWLCRYCENRFCSEVDLKRHCDANHTIIICRICKDVTFTNEGEYRDHIRTVHNGIDREIFKCDKCGAEYKTIGPFRRHLETQCGKIKPFQCDQCPMAFVTKYNLKQHKELHSGQRKFCCSYCGKNFLQKGRLVEHERSHTGEKPYKCDVCGKCFAHRESIVTHSSIHTGIRLVECKCCLSRFSCYSNLIKHRRTRPDTCGLPQYNPPKNRVRTHLSRIPPTLNPTSEIKVNNINKIINPIELDQVRKAEKTVCQLDKATKTAAKKGRKKIPNESKTTSELFVDVQNFDTMKTMIATSDFEKSEASCAGSESTDEAAIFEDHYDLMQFDVCTIKEEIVNGTKLSHDDGTSDNEVIYDNEDNIFNEKNKILDCLFSNDTTENFSRNETTYKDILDEPEMILINTSDNGANAKEEVDMLTVNDTDVDLNRIKLESDTSEFLEENTSSCSKISIKELSRRKRKKDNEPLESNTKSAPKITQKELKAQLQLLKEDKKSWSCPYCVKIYHMKKPFEKHLREDHGRPEEEIKGMLETKIDISDDVFKCHICGKNYLVKKRLMAHINLHGPNGDLIFKCPCYCNVYFASKDEATLHAQKEHRNLLYCDICEKFMTGHDSLKHHMKLHHLGKELRSKARNLVCDKCGKKFSGRTPLTDHVRSDCGRLPLYQCPICGKHLTTAGILKTHMLLHKDETPYQCDKCGKTFKVKAQYKMHIKTRHTEYKPFKCHLCPKEYPYRESLLTHMTIHTGIKRFLCNGCGKRFTCISNLQAHRKVQSETCGTLPLNAKATQYMGVQKGNLLIGAKPEAGFDYQETNTLIAKEVLQKLPNVPDTAPATKMNGIICTAVTNTYPESSLMD